MPTGNTVQQLATYLAECLPGRVADQVLVLGRPSAALTGIGIATVEPVGKHLLIHFTNGQALRSDLGMHGSWHRYPAEGPREDGDQPGGQLSIEITIGAEVFACFNARDVQVFPRNREHPLAPLVRRARALCPPSAPVVDALLDRRIAAGISNSCKSEALFLAGISPTRELQAISREELEALFDHAQELLSASAAGAPDRPWVYSRTDLPCHVCRTPIRSARLGNPPRGTFWCPACQAS